MSPETVALRQRLYDLMGGCCVDCSERDYDMLQLDHEANNGSIDRRMHWQRGAAKYRRYLAHGWDGLVLRCMNCNLGKALKLAQEGWHAMAEAQGPSQDEKNGEGSSLGIKREQWRVSTTLAVKTAVFERAKQTQQYPGQVIEDLAKFLDGLTYLDVISERLAAIEAKLEAPLTSPMPPSSPPDAPHDPWWALSQEGIVAAERTAPPVSQSYVSATPVPSSSYLRRFMRFLWTH